MKFLFAAPDRDLLECYRKLLESDFGEVVTAFDGTQVLSLASSKNFDLVILDETIPRIDFGTLVARMREKKLPVIGLINEPVSARRLSSEPVASAYLSYPFCPEDLAKTVKDTLDYAASDEKLDFSGLEITVADFRIKDGPYLTAGEIDVLRALSHGETVTDEKGAYISALNTKFAVLRSEMSIKYRTEKGFEPVNGNE